MKNGFTTGSCAAAASKAAVYMLLSGIIKNQIKIETPKGIDFIADIVDIKRAENSVSCAVIKNGGDDPDVTTGCHIVSTVSCTETPNEELLIEIDGGEGVGRVTMPGLDQKVGNAAINHVPRQMIEKEVTEVCNLFDYKGKISIIISVPEGIEVAEKTFNKRLGIISGISILGTSGIVEPMSSQALKDTIYIELRQNRSLGKSSIVITPGNYGLEFMKDSYNYDLDKGVKCSNFIGETLDMAISLGFTDILLTGHIGKLIKIAGGIMNTHSKEGDCRMELLAVCGIKAGCNSKVANDILNQVVTEKGIDILIENNLLEKTMEIVIQKVMFYLNKRTEGKANIGCIIYSNQHGLLAKSSNAIELLEKSR